MSEIILFDLASKFNKCFSPTVWRARLYLNYKKIPYTTEFVPYEVIQTKFQELGVPPHSPPTWSDYTVPVVKLPDGTFVMESRAIAKALEKLYPERPLHLDMCPYDESTDVCQEVIMASFGPAMLKLVNDGLSEESKAWFIADRERRLGMSLEAFAEQWHTEGSQQLFRDKLEKLRELLVKYKRDKGPFVLGSTLSYADFPIAALLESWVRFAPDAYEHILNAIQGLREIQEALKLYTVKDD